MVDHEVGDLQQILRAAWAVMSPGQRSHLMAAAETLDVLREGEDYVEVAQLRACLLRDDGLHRVVIEVTRSGDGTEPQVTSVRLFDGASEVEGADNGLFGPLARRLDNEFLRSMPPQAVEPAWVSTIDWDLQRDVLTHSVQIEGVEHDIQAARWLEASEALDRNELPFAVPSTQDERRVVMELGPAMGRAGPRWVELTLNTEALDVLRAGESLALGGPNLPVRAGGAARGKLPSDRYDSPTLEVIHFGEALQLRGLNAYGHPAASARVSRRLFLQWMDDRPKEETLFVAESGRLMNDEADFARHYLWVDEYHRSFADGLGIPDDTEQTEFETERPRG